MVSKSCWSAGHRPKMQNKDGKDAGIKLRVRNYKNKTGTPWRDAGFIRFEYCCS